MVQCGYMLHDIVIALWFFIPAGMANIAPVLAVKIPWIKRFDAPIDGGRTLGGKRLLGANKTWRGILAGMVLAAFTLALQQAIVASSPQFAHFLWPVNYAAMPTLLLGSLFAIGALGGDAIESFFKRQLDIRPGTAWVPFDQIDYVIGAILATAPIVHLSWQQNAWAIVLWVGIHFGAAYVGYLLKLKKTPV